MKKLSLVMIVAFLLTLTACSGTTSKTSGTAKKDLIKIGAIYPLTGSLAQLGEESYRGAVLAVDEFNKKGGINGQKVELVKADAPDPNAAQSEANRLVNQDNVKTVVGSYSSSISFAASQVTERNNVLFWELGAVSDTITDRNYKNLLRINPPASYFSKVDINFVKNIIAKKLGKNASDVKVAIVHEDSSYGTTIATEATKLAEKDGIKIVTNQPYSATTNDLSSVILNLKKSQPDVLLAVSYLNDAELLARQSKELGFKVPVIIGNGGGHTMKDYQQAVGDLANGVFDVDFPQYNINKKSTPGMDQFLKLYKAKYSSDPRSGHSLANYMGMNIVLDVLKKVGSDDPAKLKEAALKFTAETDSTSTGWGVKFNPTNGQNTLSEPYVHEWINGNLDTVYPQNVAVQEPQIIK